MKHSVYTPFTKDPCDIGQIMRGLIAVCRLWKGDTWTRKIAICNGGNEERSCLLGLQPDASVLLCVLYSPSHWVLLVATRPVQGSSPAHPAPACVLYDGKHADLVLARLFEDGCLPAVLRGPTEQEIRVLLDTAAKCARMKREREQEAASRPAAAAAARILQDDDEEYEEHDDAEDDEEHEEDVEDARDIGHAEESMESEPNEARTPKRSKTTARSFLDTPGSKFSDEAMTPPAVSRKVTTLDRAPRKGQAEKAAKKANKAKRAKPAQNAERSKKERQAAGLARCNERGVGHTLFQKKHYAAGCPPAQGHWQCFLEAAGDSSKVLVCTICEEMLETLDSDAAGRQAAPASSLVASPAPATLGPRIHSRGRPRKGEAAESRWSLSLFIKQHRQDIYEQTSESFAKAAKYRCKACRREIKFGSQTCPKKLYDHETGQRHKDGVDRLRGHQQPAEGQLCQLVSVAGGGVGEGDNASNAQDCSRPCNGVPSNNPLLPMHDLEWSLTEFVMMGQPRTVYAQGETDPAEQARFIVQDG